MIAESGCQGGCGSWPLIGVPRGAALREGRPRQAVAARDRSGRLNE
jgi:hypothetical protein